MTKTRFEEENSDMASLQDGSMSWQTLQDVKENFEGRSYLYLSTAACMYKITKLLKHKRLEQLPSHC